MPLGLRKSKWEIHDTEEVKANTEEIKTRTDAIVRLVDRFEDPEIRPPI